MATHTLVHTGAHTQAHSYLYHTRFTLEQKLQDVTSVILFNHLLLWLCTPELCVGLEFYLCEETLWQYFFFFFPSVSHFLMPASFVNSSCEF